MKFETELVPATLVRRYKRFLADVVLANGDTITVHCPNTGAMLGCAEPGASVWLSESDNPSRKYRHTWELVAVADEVLVGIHTGRSNRLVAEALDAGIITQLAGYRQRRPEVKYGRESSRIDFLLDDHCGGAPQCYLEVKNVTAAVDDGVAVFPDAVSARGTRHLRELCGVVQEGHRAALCFCVQRSDVREVRPADSIDPDYGRALREAQRTGVDVFAYKAAVSANNVQLTAAVPVVCPD